MSLHEIVLPETKPETEWVRGRALQKVSPIYSHARLQGLIGAALMDWADAGEHGRAGTDWRFRVAPPGKIVRPLVPDVAYLSFATLPRDASPAAYEVPLGSPTVAVEILSPDDRPRDVADKIDTYLCAGSAAVVVVDPIRTTFAVHDPNQPVPRLVSPPETFTHPALPGFALDLAALFARARR
jgi:Uma2 family endonuclease